MLCTLQERECVGANRLVNGRWQTCECESDVGSLANEQLYLVAKLP